MSLLHEFVTNVGANLFKPLLLFFYAGFAVPLLGVKLDFPKAAYQALTIYLLLAIGWHGGEELAALDPSLYGQAAGFMIVGFLTNLVIGIAAYVLLRQMTRLRKIDAATVAGYYGSDSAGTFVTCLGVLASAQIAFAPYMPVLLAVMEIPGCLVALFLVAQLRRQGMDLQGNMPGELGYGQAYVGTHPHLARVRVEHPDGSLSDPEMEQVLVHVGAEDEAFQSEGSSVNGRRKTSSSQYERRTGVDRRHAGYGGDNHDDAARPDRNPMDGEEKHGSELGLESFGKDEDPALKPRSRSWLNRELLHEVFLNPGIFLLFAGIAIGLISRLQGEKVTMGGDALFNNLFQGCLCLFLLEMGMTASAKLKDLGRAGWQFVAFALLAPNLFAVTGIVVAHLYSALLGQPLELGTYVLFAVLCGAASYIALPAVQRLAIPEASPTLPLAASLGVTFSYNVTIGIPVYLLIAKTVITTWPVLGPVAA
jgi:uncharacterized protein